MGIFSIFGKNKITINGKSYEVSGKKITVENDSIYVDGVLVESGLSGKSQPIKVEFTGDLASLDCTNATITGNVTGNVDGTNITCGDVGGSIDGTTIKCGNVSGNVEGVNITCGDIMGKVDGSNFKFKK